MSRSQAFARGFLGFFDSLSLTGWPQRRKQAPVCQSSIKYVPGPCYTCTLPAGHRNAHFAPTTTGSANWL
jgi:hypothetical protein